MSHSVYLHIWHLLAGGNSFVLLVPQNWVTCVFTTLNFFHICTSCDIWCTKMSTRCFFGFHRGFTNLSAAPDGFYVFILGAAAVIAQLHWSLCGRVCVSLFMCVKTLHAVCVWGVPERSMCAPAHTQPRYPRVWKPRPWTAAWVCCRGGLCNVNKQRQQQQQLRWLPLSLSYVVIRSGWKCGTTMPLTITKHFSQAKDYRQSGCGLLSPLRATCPCSSGHWSQPAPLPPAI